MQMSEALQALILINDLNERPRWRSQPVLERAASELIDLMGEAPDGWLLDRVRRDMRHGRVEPLPSYSRQWQQRLSQIVRHVGADELEPPVVLTGMELHRWRRALRVAIAGGASAAEAMACADRETGLSQLRPAPDKRSVEEQEAERDATIAECFRIVREAAGPDDGSDEEPVAA